MLLSMFEGGGGYVTRDCGDSSSTGGAVAYLWNVFGGIFLMKIKNTVKRCNMFKKPFKS